MAKRILVLLLSTLAVQACTTTRTSEEKPVTHTVEHDPRTRTQEPSPSRVR